MKIQKELLPDFDGKSAFSGALRFFDRENKSWEKEWGGHYESLMPEIDIFAIDAFGTVYGLSNGGEVVIFWSETGDIEPLGVGENEFYEIIVDDPINTINYDLYLAAIQEYRELSYDEHFAFKIETALGGELSTDNISIMNAIDHFKALGKLANKIKDIPEGEVVSNVLLDE